MAFESKRNDVSKFTAGAWVPMFGAEFKIARAGNPDYEQALEESGYRKAETPEEKQKALLKAVAKGILKDWRDVLAEGQPIECTTENAVAVLEENPDLLNRIIAEANDLTHYRREDIKRQAKKPQTTSGS
ncbi:hypothetical protein [Marinobacter nauticus]|uniref:Uncharacterized protein n=1 Tax=Marinobacter nauticus TaxID=2743 RepID=A0A1M2V0X8_MARNT|nr:hypothetical protein [Marinobacter nauticus]OJT01234.1 hypothetical protein BEE62_14895 [Marinobacter nauticus]